MPRWLPRGRGRPLCGNRLKGRLSLAAAQVGLILAGYYILAPPILTLWEWPGPW